MPDYKVYYWMQQGERGRAVCESVTADSMDDATAHAQANLERKSFAFESDQDGRVIVVSAHVQYVEVEDAGHIDSPPPPVLHIA
jgi:hypothetical protein